jgi:hypothetical protein
MIFFLSFFVYPIFGAEPKIVVVDITPRAIETPLLKYRFVPREDELKPGNAVPILLRLPWEQRTWMEKVYPNLHKWDEVPLTDPKWKDYSDISPRFFDEMKRAAYRREANWEYPIGEVPAMIIAIPDVQGLRTFLGNGLSSKAKYHLSKGELNETLEVIKVGITNSRHLANTPFIINQLVAAQIQRTMFDRTVDLISQPQSPNLYWGLSTIPKGILSLERTADFEGQMLVMTFPFVDDLDKPRTKEEWKKLFDQQLLHLADTWGLIVPKGEVKKKEAFAEVEKLARKELTNVWGHTPEKIASMTMEEAVLRWFISNHKYLDDSYSAFMALPPREALPRLIELNQDSNNFYNKMDSKFFEFFKNPLFNYLTLQNNYRKIQILRVIEAVRHYAGTHDGKFPVKLEEITDIPVPIDPITDKPFEWKVKDNEATLGSPQLPEGITKILKNNEKDYLLEMIGVKYHLKIRKNK